MARTTKKSQQKSKKKRKQLIHIDEFIAEYQIANDLELSNAQIAGFKATMQGKHYQPNLKDFVPYIKEYLQ